EVLAHLGWDRGQRRLPRRGVPWAGLRQDLGGASPGGLPVPRPGAGALLRRRLGAGRPLERATASGRGACAAPDVPGGRGRLHGEQRSAVADRRGGPVVHPGRPLRGPQDLGTGDDRGRAALRRPDDARVHARGDHGDQLHQRPPATGDRRVRPLLGGADRAVRPYPRREPARSDPPGRARAAAGHGRRSGRADGRVLPRRSWGSDPEGGPRAGGRDVPPGLAARGVDVLDGRPLLRRRADGRVRRGRRPAHDRRGEPGDPDPVVPGVRRTVRGGGVAGGQRRARGAPGAGALVRDPAPRRALLSDHPDRPRRVVAPAHLAGQGPLARRRPRGRSAVARCPPDVPHARRAGAAGPRSRGRSPRQV
ncbi:MAG: conserved hypothetical protein 374, partial [uncultured Thermomicrobiales bacterium]